MRTKNFLEKFIPSSLLNWYHFLLAFLGAFFYGLPSQKLKIIGITGTGGKSTVVEFCHQILKEAGKKVASISSISFKIREKEWRNELKMTMPGRLKLQRFLRQAINAGCEYVILEVTSEGILQHRQRFVDFNTVVFTNLVPEHVERHGSFEKYREAKGRLFEQTKKIHILNLNDENTEYFLKFEAEKKIGFTTLGGRTSSKSLTSVIEAKNIQEGPAGISFIVQNTKFNLNLLGKFNTPNALAAICVGLSQGIDLATCQRALEKIKVIPGRMEIVIGEPFKVIVDYAHTPDSLEQVYKTIQNSKFKIPNSRLICVLGATGGGRDKWKRPKMGGIAAKYCNEVIITNEDPYDENPLQIINEIEQGILKLKTQNSKLKTFQKILDRREAIKKALSFAKPNNVVVITGKGSESWMCVAKGKKIPWDDREVVREQLHELKIKS
ncbi:UDP-N-acetylmuramoyl-L-alanyl-D-glutamate--2,6-diaminopimelate ligase [Patescibacteria group bacterium]|nr:UDP-N-acetylmuramoyl-L-alanyl-D-glutamate--2,6-diaminopimelate ligase [Patescibacteria group bacterium]